VAYFENSESGLRRYIDRDKLVSLLQGLPARSIIAVTPVGELGVFDGDGDQLGYIAIGSETYEEF
jgi:hypothetical protein